MTIPKEQIRDPLPPLSEKYLQLEEMLKLSRKCFPYIQDLIKYEMGREELNIARERGRRLAAIELKSRK